MTMDRRYAVVPARAEHVGALADVERAAAALLADHAPAAVLADVTSEADFRRARRTGRLWVALAGEGPVGFALVEMLAADLPHLEEMDVDPRHGRRGIGGELLRAACDWARGAGYRELTLTTFRSVPWNMPFYAKAGFEEVRPGDLRPELRAVVAAETRRGLDPARRVVMRRRLQDGAQG
jgi:GNAT superfamily N-acetyltransferase